MGHKKPEETPNVLTYEQLCLGLKQEPWDGRSPRDLTRAAFLFSFSARPAETSLEDRIVEEQYLRFLNEVEEF